LTTSSAAGPVRGSFLGGGEGGPRLRQHADEVDSVRDLHYVTALRTVGVAYIEV
jgi:hypothetical protein